MTAFWLEARQRGVGREQGQKLLAAAQGDPRRALAALDKAA